MARASQEPVAVAVGAVVPLALDEELDAACEVCETCKEDEACEDGDGCAVDAACGDDEVP